MAKKTVLIISNSHIGSDPRVKRQINALKDTFDITTLGRSAIPDSTIAFYQIYSIPPFSLVRKIKRFFQLISKRYDDYYWDDNRKQLLKQFREKDFDVIIANDIQTLPLAIMIADKKAKVYFDAHEYHPSEFEDNFKWRLLDKQYIRFLCKQYIPMVQAFSTVSERIAKEYEKFTGVLPCVITNASSYYDLTPVATTNKRIKLVHHGAAIPSRKIELMIHMAMQLDERFVMDFILVGNQKKYISHLKKIAGNSSRIRFLQPVEADNICEHINTYDLGIFLLPPTNFNYLNALPNKLFEFVQARLGIVVSSNPDMAELVRKYELGIVINDYTSESMANAINLLTAEQIMAFKKNSDMAAKILAAEENMKKINGIVTDLIFNT